MDIVPFFLARAQHSLFCLHLTPATAECKGAVLYIHPYAEEMHKSRRMAALQARRLAAAGYQVLQVDLTGCGDSSGDFSQANWEIWCDDVLAAAAWLQQRCSAPLILWGLRLGATLAAQMARPLHASRLLLWQPVLNGEQFLTQFLRIKLASEMLSDGQAQGSTKALVAQLQAGETIEVGGYTLAPNMAQQLAQVKMLDIQPACPVTWLELGAEAREGLTPASTRVLEAWRTKTTVHTATVIGDPFWGVQEITECAALIEKSMEHLAHE